MAYARIHHIRVQYPAAVSHPVDIGVVGVVHIPVHDRTLDIHISYADVGLAGSVSAFLIHIVRQSGRLLGIVAEAVGAVNAVHISN